MRVEVLNVDRVAHQIVTDAEGPRPGIIDDDRLRGPVADRDRRGRRATSTVAFVIQEWEQVVLAQGIEVPRRVLRRLTGWAGNADSTDADRATVWKVIEAATGELARRKGQRTFLQIADAAAGYLGRGRREALPTTSSSTRPRTCTRRSGACSGPLVDAGPERPVHRR
ncbi:MAG: hypothetical protein V9E94_14110 [Microthrixaceae bacterium]